MTDIKLNMLAGQKGIITITSVDGFDGEVLLTGAAKVKGSVQAFDPDEADERRLIIPPMPQGVWPYAVLCNGSTVFKGCIYVADSPLLEDGVCSSWAVAVSRDTGILNATVTLSEGPQGPQGETGPQGEPGASAYDLAVAAGYTGTQDEWATAQMECAQQAADAAASASAALAAASEAASSAGAAALSASNAQTASDAASGHADQAAGSASSAVESQTAAAASASAAAISAAEAAASAALAMEGVVEKDAMMALARSICFAKTPFPEEFLMAAEATTGAEWQSLAPNSYAINGADQEVYVEYHPNSTGGKNPWQMSPVAQRYYLVTKKTSAPNSGWMCRGVYNFIWNLDSSDAALGINSLDLALTRFWFVYVPEATVLHTEYNNIYGRNASVIIIAPKLTSADFGIIKDPQEQIATVATKHYIRCYLPSLNTSCKVAAYHRALAGGVILTLGSLPDVTGNSTRPTITMGLDPDAVASIAEDGSMTFTDANLQTAVDAAVAKGWTVAFNVTPMPESASEASVASLEAPSVSPAAALNTLNAVSVMSAGETGLQAAKAAQTTTPPVATAAPAKASTQLWYHAEASEYGDYLNADGQRVAITSAKGFAGAAEDGSWRRCASEDEAADAWGLTHDPLEPKEPEADTEATING